MPASRKGWKRKASKVSSPLITSTKTPSLRKRRQHSRKEVTPTTAPPIHPMAASIESLNAMPNLGATLSLLQSLGLTLQPAISVPHVATKVVTSKTNPESQLLSSDSSSTDSSDCEAVTPKEKASRIRAACRLKIKKAKALTEKKKKAGLKPYVISIDAYCRQNGPHSRLWTRMVRGQDKRLNYSIDNIKGHPTSEVESIFESLSCQFEYTGFASSAVRQLFQKTLVKFLRNRRYAYMQVIKKGGEKPHDISLEHWENLLKASMGEKREVQCSEMAAVRQNSDNYCNPPNVQVSFFLENANCKPYRYHVERIGVPRLGCVFS